MHAQDGFLCFLSPNLTPIGTLFKGRFSFLIRIQDCTLNFITVIIAVRRNEHADFTLSLLDGSCEE